MLFKNRTDAGRQLALRLSCYRDSSPIVLGLARGGVEVGREIARELGSSIEALIVRKISAPGYPGLGIGALAEGGVRVVDSLAIKMMAVSGEQLGEIEAAEQAEVLRRLALFRRNRSLPDVKGRTVILVDDGLASGVTAKAAIERVLRDHPEKIIFAVPVTGPFVAAAMLGRVDELVAVACPPDFIFVNDWYEDFDDCDETMLLEILDEARMTNASTIASAPSRSFLQTPTVKPDSKFKSGCQHVVVKIETCGGCISGWLDMPQTPHGVVLFAHGAGSNRNSPRTKVVADQLSQAGFATLRIDLLTDSEYESESQTKHLRFNIGLLTERVLLSTNWLKSNLSTHALPVGYYGASTGGSAMLAAASKQLYNVKAVVCRGGRPDLVEPLLKSVNTPTLLLAGGKDTDVLGYNRNAFHRIGTDRKELVIIDGATHLFEEPGGMEKVGSETVNWMSRFLTSKK